MSKFACFLEYLIVLHYLVNKLVQHVLVDFYFSRLHVDPDSNRPQPQLRGLEVGSGG